MLEETDIFDMLFEAASSFDQARIPEEVKGPLMSARLTALAKKDGGVRGIATGSTLRAVGREDIGQAIRGRVEEECAPFQYALSTRAGVGHMLRAATDHDHRATILKVDGIGAYDHTLRLAMLTRLVQMPGGEQGDPLMPLLFSIGIQGALEEVANVMRPDEQVCAFLDDVYIVCQPERVRVLHDWLAESLIRVAGIHLHEGKTRVWNASGTMPDNVEELGPDVWLPRGITVLGTPIGSVEYTTEKVERRLAEERLLWESISAVPDLQCAWQILLQSANPRGNHTIRTLPPARAEGYTRS